MRYLNLCRNVSNWWEYLFFKFKIRRNDPLEFRCRNGISAVVPLRLLQSFKEVFFSECYTKYLPANRLERSDPNIVDIGANVGYFSLFLLSKYPQARVIAFEPIPKNFDLLEKHRRLNPTKRLVTVNRAVGGTTGKMVLLHDERDSFTTSASIFDRGIGSDPLEVPCVSLADLLKEYRLDRVDLLKMDCEGSEYDILYGCPTRIFKFLHAIVLECHACSGENRNPEALGRFLESRGYATRHGGRGVLWAWRER